MYSSNYEIVSSGAGTKIPLDNTDFIADCGFDEVTSVPNYITLSCSYGNIKATYKFKSYGSLVTIAYDVIFSKYDTGVLICTYGNTSQVKLTVDKYNYSSINFASHTFADTKADGGDSHYNDALEKLGVYIGQKTIDYIQGIYDATKDAGIVTTGEADPDLDYTLTVNATDGAISAVTNMTYYSLKVQNSSGENVYYSTNAKAANVTNLDSGVYRVIAIFENPKDNYVLRQILTYSIQVN